MRKGREGLATIVREYFHRDPRVSPDKKKILYNVEFISLKADKGNKELWTMNIDGSNPQKIGHSST